MPDIDRHQLVPVAFDPFATDGSVRLPLTRQQSEVWVESQMGREASCAYNQCFVLHLNGPLSIASMSNAFDAVLARHAALRASFDREGAEQRIAPSRKVEVAFHDLASTAAGERERAIAAIIEREANEPFDLVCGPVLRAHVVREHPERHRLIVTVHHIVCDGWSSSVMFSDLARAYAADRLGLEARLPAPMSYAEYVAAECYRSDAAEDEAYWLARYQDDVPVLDLPLDRKRPQARTRNGARETLAIEPSLYKQLKAVGAKSGATLYHTLLAGFETLMLRLSGQSDMVVGIPTAGQAELENGHLVAHCVATLPLRCGVDPQARFADVLKGVRTGVLDAQAHQNVTFSSLVPKLAIERDPSRPVLVSVVFNIDKLGARFDFGDLTVEHIETPKRFVTFDLNVNVVDSGSDLVVECEYNTDILDAATVSRWLGHYRELLNSVVRDAGQQVGRLAIMAEEERARQVVGSMGRTFPVSTLHGLFEAQVRRSGDAVAVVCGEERLSYGELNARANRVAHALRGEGIGRGDLVGLSVERTADIAVGILAILKAGGAYLPLDPDYPRDRLGFMVEDAKVRVVLGCVGQEAPGGARLIDIASAGAGMPESDPEPLSGPQDLAYVIYTSGSTGKPKGALVTHANVSRLFTATEVWFGFGAQDVWTLFHSYAFDFSVWELWGALLYGGRVVVVPYWVSRDPAAFRRLLIDERVTVLNQTPSAFRQLVQADLMEAPADYALRSVVFGGEALELHALKPWFERYGDRKPQLVNMYGITETTVHVTYRPITLADVEAGRGSVIGEPIPDLYIRLLDQRGEPVPVGVPGEIWVGGAGVAQGYLERPELTAQRFMADPFDASGQSRLYRAGDLARRLADGDLEFLGRIDAQVKIRGFRIELGEIEAALSACAGVGDAAVIAREDAAGDKRLVAYVVGRDGVDPSTEELRRALSAALPEHMVPAHFVALPALPLNANGKLDRKALPAPAGGPLRAVVGPKSQTEEAIAAIWRQVLKCEAVDCAQDFFRLGGHSLLATQVASRLRDVFRIELPLVSLFQHRTVQALAAYVDALMRDQRHAAPMPAVEPRVSGEPARLSLSQERMWLIHELAPDNRAYNIPIALELEGNLDIGALGQALDALRQQHETLRTVYRLDGAYPVQIVEAWTSEPLAVVDLANLGDGALKEALRQAADIATKPFDLARDGMMRVALFRLGDRAHLLLLTIHHIAIDDWALGLLSSDLAKAYNNLRAGRAAGLARPAITYADYSVWQRQWLEKEHDRQMAFWRERLKGIVPLELPTDRPRPPVFGFHGRLHGRQLPEALLSRLEQLSRAEGVTLFMTMLSAYLVLLHRSSGQDELSIAVPIANRTQTATERLVGSFINTLVLRCDLSGNPRICEVLQRVSASALDAYAHQDVPFERLVEELVSTRDASRPPLAQVMFNLLNAPAGGFDLDGLSAHTHAIELNAAQFELGFQIDAANARSLMVEYNTDLFDESTIQRFVDQYLRLLEQMLESVETRISDVTLLAPAEHERVVRGLNETAADYPSDTVLSRLFEAQASATPQAVAVRFDGAELTYAELNARANRLAHSLIGRGAGRGTLVGLCLDRSLDLVVTLLAIQKSGAGYVPLDPGFPADRLSYMLADSGASLLVTTGEAAAGVEIPDGTIVLDPEAEAQAIAQMPASDPATAAAPGDLAYILYTSGSTGKPKGVAVPHGALVNFLWSMKHEPGLTSADVLAAVTTISFDIAGLELYLPLIVGARIELVSRDTAADGALLARLIADSGATVLQATPATWRMLIEEGWKGGRSLRALCGGEALPPDLAEALLGRVGELWNLYGPTETTIWSTVERIKPGDAVLKIGRPIANTQVYVLDKAGQPTSVGVPGEIWIGGDGVALGYHRRPELTAERFVPDRFSQRAGARLYRTGDLGRWLQDGRLQHLGRMDNQVKVRGFRIELGEIEAALNDHPAVRQSAVITREARAGDMRILAYIVVHDGEELTVSDVRRHLRTSLPDYMIPSFVMTLPALPLTANGKIDRAALPDPFRAAVAEAVVSEPPAPGMETRVAEIWREVLKVETINAGDNFFDLGGHSLLAVRVTAALERQIGWRMDPRTLFFQTLRQVAAGAEAATQHGPLERIA